MKNLKIKKYLYKMGIKKLNYLLIIFLILIINTNLALSEQSDDERLETVFYENPNNGLIYMRDSKNQVWEVKKDGSLEKSFMKIDPTKYPSPYIPIEKPPRVRINELTQQAAKELTNNLLNLLLGEFAYDQVSQVCKEDWESSEPASDTPRTASSGIIDPLQDGLNDNGLLNNCPQAVTTVTAQATKLALTNEVSYKTSYTINPCKQSITYTVYMANSVDDRIGLESGAANKAKLISNSKHFTYPINYSSICIQVSDATIGDNGYSCFGIV